MNERKIILRLFERHQEKKVTIFEKFEESGQRDQELRRQMQNRSVKEE